MKNLLFTFILALLSTFIYAQNTFPSSGKVGIGTTSPTSSLTINSKVANNNAQMNIFNPINVNGSAAGVRLHTKSGWNVMLRTIQNKAWLELADKNGNWVHRWNGRNYFTLGNIGIGTTTPNSKLTINSKVANNNAQMNIFNPVNANGSAAGIRFHTQSGWNVMLRTIQNKAWLELADANGNWVHRWNGRNYYTMGKVGIGTTNPDSKLTVKGKIHAEEVLVDLNVPADYVFEKYYNGKSVLKSDYTMPTLKEVEAFTKANKHLPEIPSAKDIKENGIKVSEMTNLLLQKIEELTLYTIEQEKRIENLEKKLNDKQ